MRRVEAILAASLALSLAGCIVGGKPKTVASVPPPVPQPAPPVPAPPPPPEPLSLAQTQVKLPPAQPVDQEALAPAQATEMGGAVTPPKAPRRTTPAPPTTTPPRTEPPAANPPAAAATPAAEPPRAPIQEIVPLAEQKKLEESAQARRREIQKWLDTGGKRRLNRHQQSTVQRIRAFLKDSEAAEKRGDMRTADALAERAEILLRELQNGQ